MNVAISDCKAGRDELDVYSTFFVESKIEAYLRTFMLTSRSYDITGSRS